MSMMFIRCPFCFYHNLNKLNQIRWNYYYFPFVFGQFSSYVFIFLLNLFRAKWCDNGNFVCCGVSHADASWMLTNANNLMSSPFDGQRCGLRWSETTTSKAEYQIMELKTLKLNQKCNREKIENSKGSEHRKGVALRLQYNYLNWFSFFSLAYYTFFFSFHCISLIYFGPAISKQVFSRLFLHCLFSPLLFYLFVHCGSCFSNLIPGSCSSVAKVMILFFNNCFEGNRTPQGKCSSSSPLPCYHNKEINVPNTNMNATWTCPTWFRVCLHSGNDVKYAIAVVNFILMDFSHSSESHYIMRCAALASPSASMNVLLLIRANYDKQTEKIICFRLPNA